MPTFARATLRFRGASKAREAQSRGRFRAATLRALMIGTRRTGLGVLAFGMARMFKGVFPMLGRNVELVPKTKRRGVGCG